MPICTLSFDRNCDLLDGEFPVDPIIKGVNLKQIDVFSDKTAGDNAVITGLTIMYDGVGKRIASIGSIVFDNVPGR